MFNNINDTSVIPPEVNEYVFVVSPETGQRITSLLVGIHGDTVNQCVNKAKRDYPGMQYLTGGEDKQQLFYKGYWYDGKDLVPPLPPTQEEIEAARVNALNTERAGYENELHERLKVAELQGDPALIASIRDEYVDMNEAYVEALKGAEA